MVYIFVSKYALTPLYVIYQRVYDVPADLQVTYYSIALGVCEGRGGGTRTPHHITPLMNTVGLFFVVVAEESITDGIDKHHANYISPMQS